MGHGIYLRGSLKFSKVDATAKAKLDEELLIDAEGNSPTIAFWRFSGDDLLVSVQNKHYDDYDPLTEINDIKKILDPFDVKLNGVILYIDYDCRDIGFLNVTDSVPQLLDFCEVKTAHWIAMKNNFANFDDNEQYRYLVRTKYY